VKQQVPPFSHSKFARSMSSTVGHRLTACFMPSSSFTSGSCDITRWCVRREARPARVSLSSQCQVWRGAASTTTQDRSSTDAGEIHIIFGPMFAGKTTALLERIAEEEAKGKTVTLVKSSKDCRYSEDKIVSHDGTERQCTPVFRLGDLRGIVGEEKWTNTDVIAIDEAQFIPDLVSFCVTVADEHNKKVIVAGLDGDFKRARFGEILDLLPLCDSVTKLTAQCGICLSRPALFSLRTMLGENTQELVGGSDAYKPACRACYLKNATYLGS
jgi:thymidine kinase